jgi:hypothetical protein
MQTKRAKARLRRDVRIRQTTVRTIEGLFQRDDVDRPRVLDRSSRLALKETIEVATRCEETFAKLRRSARRLVSSYSIDYLCSFIELGMRSFSEVRSLGRTLKGVHLDHPRRGPASFESLFVEHARLYRQLRSPKTDFSLRLSALVSLNQIELIFFAHMW